MSFTSSGGCPQGYRIDKSSDESKSRIFHTRANGTQERQLPDGPIHHPFMHQALDVVEHGFTLLLVELSGSLAKQLSCP